jgi:hypothetical protein
MKYSLLIPTALLVILTSTPAQQSAEPHPAAAQAPPASPPSLSSQVPSAHSADVNSLDSILRALYDVISGPPGDRDWNRLRSLCVPEARLTSTVKSATSTTPPRLLTVNDYIQRAGKYFSTHGFYEAAIVNRVQEFGNIAQVFSSYESRNAPDEKPFTRGINSIQLFHDGSRWWVLSILWDEESPTHPLPPEMATKPSSPISQ